MIYVRMMQLSKRSFVGCAAGFGKLVAAGGSPSIAGDAADFLLYLFYSQSLYQSRDCLQVAIAAACKFYIFNNISVQFHLYQGGTSASGLI